MKILSSNQIRDADAYTIKHEPIDSIDLMERAARRCTEWLKTHAGPEQSYKIFTGPGNNGGDGLAIARQLAEDKAHVEVYRVGVSTKLSKDPVINLQRLKGQSGVTIHEVNEETNLPDISKNEMVIDALFGSGLTRPLDGLAATTVAHINNSGATVVSIDIPSGLFGEDNSSNGDMIIRASHTLTFQIPKLAFFFAENEQYTGQWHVLPIGLDEAFISRQAGYYFFTQESDILPLLKKRTKFAHKGHFGHAQLFSGSYGKMGAAVLASRGCLNAGAGLLTVHVPRCGYTIMQTAVPEAMVTVDPAEEALSAMPVMENINAVGIGPGIGTNPFTQEMLKNLLTNTSTPIVIDADALNILSRNKEWLSLLPPDIILTPHPGEFDRLAGKSTGGYERHLKQIAFAKQYKIYVVLKGAYTSIATPEGNYYFNSTGNPGMATGGSGDVLTGIILSLLAQYYTPLHACLLGVFLHGLAGDLAASDIGMESLLAGDIINHIGNAFKKLY